METMATAPKRPETSPARAAGETGAAPGRRMRSSPAKPTTAAAASPGVTGSRNHSQATRGMKRGMV